MHRKLRRTYGRLTRGQGLVEMTLALPVLLIMLLGLVELGFLLHAYIVLYNADREATRFAVRGTFTPEEIAERAMTSISEQLPAELEGADANTAILITQLYIPADKDDFATVELYWHAGISVTSRFVPQDHANKIKLDNDLFNQEVMDAELGLGPTSQEVVIVEMFHNHDQVLHAPFVEWVFPDPMEVYAWTIMRVLEQR
jgi:hypothetical protein